MVEVPPLIFLDVDGVLNSVDYLTRRGKALYENRYDHYLSDFDPEACAVLATVCEKSGASLVISSTWRVLHPLEEIRGYLLFRGVTAPVIGKTPDMDLHNNPGLSAVRSRWERGLEIQHWLQTFVPPDRLPGVRVCVLDDDGDMGDVRGAWVKIDNQRGLREDHLPTILDHLGRTLADSRAAGGPGRVSWTYVIDPDWVHRAGSLTTPW